ncbi:hypothetical protein [Microbacterium sp.]|uniref:hypothetical protein n=1 Tax=Microbacterium sp. TaxID=51671 RepID=UPI0035652B47
MTDPEDVARLARLQDARASMESLHAEALAERDGRTFTMVETLALIRQHDLIIDTMGSLAIESPEPSPAILERVRAHVEGQATVQKLSEKVKRGAAADEG